MRERAAGVQCRQRFCGALSDAQRTDDSLDVMKNNLESHAFAMESVVANSVNVVATSWDNTHLM